MKITCDSCGSKYTIADAKVKGRKVKVRCKGCKESILVDGTQLDEASAEESSDDESNPEAASTAEKETSAPAEEAPKKDKNLWSVNLTDDDSRDMTLEELIAGWKSGLVTSDAYVWKDGMGDWKPILEVGELKLKLGSPPEKKGAGVVSSAAAPAAVAAAKPDDKGDDLFGGVDLAGDEPSEAEKPAVSAGGGKPTGARNDSSVLFSLDSLNAGGDDKKDKTDAVDLFGNLNANSPQLTNSADLLTAPAKEPPPAPAGARVAAAAPVQQKGKGGMIAAIVVVLALLGGAAFMLGGSGDKAAAEDPAALAAKAKAEKEAEEARQKAEDERKKLAAELKKMQDELKKAREEATKKGEDPEEAEAKKKAELEEAKKEEEAKAKTTTSKSSSSSSSSSSKASTASPSTKPKTTPKPAATGGAAFNVGAARAALSAASANAAACKKPGGPVGSGKVQVTFSTSGRVTSAQVISGPFGGTAVGGCVASTFRRARVPAFSGSPQTVAKSFRIP